jgi:hypothetical protein
VVERPAEENGGAQVDFAIWAAATDWAGKGGS